MPIITIMRRYAHIVASSCCTTMTFLRTATTSPSCARWRTTATTNRTTSAHSGCTSTSTRALSRRSDRATGLSHSSCTTSRSPTSSWSTSPSRDGPHPLRPAHLAKALQRAAHQARGRELTLLGNNGCHHAARHPTCSRRRSTQLVVLPFVVPRQRHLRHDAGEGRKGGVLLSIVPGRL